MGFLIFTILFGIAAIISFIVALSLKAPAQPKGKFTEGTADYRPTWWIVGGVCAVLAIVILLWGSVVTVPVGHIAIMSRFGRLTGEAKPNGLSLKPVVDTPILVDLRTQKSETLNTAASKDLQDAKTTITVNYRLDPTRAVEIIRTIGLSYWDIYAIPAEQEIVKAITAKFDAQDMIQRREEVKAAITETLTKKLAERGIIAENINITNFEFSPEFTAAIESKVVAAQDVEKARNILERIRIEAQQAQARAEGEAAAAIARAKGQAEANKTIAESLTPEVLQYFFYDKLGQDVKIVVIPQGTGTVIPLPQP